MGIPKAIKVEGHDSTVVSRHIEMLYDDGRIEGFASSTMATAVKDIMIKDTSLDGHHLLAALRSDTVFAKLKSALSPSVLSVLTLKQIAFLASEVRLKAARNTLGLD